MELHGGITTGGILYEDKDIELITDTDMRRYNGKDQASTCNLCYKIIEIQKSQAMGGLVGHY